MFRTGLLVRAACREGVRHQEDRALVVVVLLVGKDDEEEEEEEEEEEGGNAPRLPARPRVLVERGEGSSALLASAKARLLGVMRGATVLARDCGAWPWQALTSPSGGILICVSSGGRGELG